MTVTLEALLVADPPEAWAEAGFAVDDDGGCRIGTVRVELVGRDHGIGFVGWTLSGVPEISQSTLDGLPTSVADAVTTEPATHPNGVVSIDHVVVLSPDLPRTVAGFGAVGLTPRRERDGVLGGQPIRQIFFRFGETIVEVVGSPDSASEGPSSLWGVTYVVADLDASADFFRGHASPVKAAVQPGRRITTLRHRELGLSVRTALISAVQRDPDAVNRGAL